MRFYSISQMGQTEFRYVIPNDMPAEMISGNPYYSRPARTLYLLHGYSGNDSDWEFNGIAEDVASKYNLAVFMISAGNDFYLNRPAAGRQYQTYAGDEIVRYTRKTFGLSKRREDTLIGGLSMGGYGAMHTALAYPETFAGAICLSSALIIHEMTGIQPGFRNPAANYEYYHEVFGDLSRLDETEANPEVQFAGLKAKGIQTPSIYMAVGTEDFLYENNQVTRKALDALGADLKYEEGPGAHDWTFWNHYIINGVEWMLQKVDQQMMQEDR